MRDDQELQGRLAAADERVKRDLVSRAAKVRVDNKAAAARPQLSPVMTEKKKRKVEETMQAEPQTDQLEPSSGSGGPDGETLADAGPPMDSRVSVARRSKRHVEGASSDRMGSRPSPDGGGSDNASKRSRLTDPTGEKRKCEPEERRESHEVFCDPWRAAHKAGGGCN